jgi:hypothetical protein
MQSQLLAPGKPGRPVAMATALSTRWLQRRSSLCPDFCRSFTSTSPLSAGHNRWSQIKHHKAKNDKAKSKERQIIGKEISSATQSMRPGV